MTRVRTLGLALALMTASVAFAPAPPAAAHSVRNAEDPILTVVGVAKQLGLTVQQRDGEEFTLGTSFTGLLADPQKLARFGMQMHQGARVTAARMALDKIRVEADEMEPVPARASATLKVDVKGELSAIPKP